MRPIDVATGLVAKRFPEALAAFLGAGVLSDARTPTSDLDIVVVRPDGHDVFRETLRHAGWPVELFVHTPSSFEAFVTREIAERRSPMLYMVARGAVLIDTDGTGTRLRAEADRRWRQGPPPATPAELEDLRYGVSDLLDDLDGATDPDEILFIATRLFTDAALLVLMAAGAWLGGGKWLGRRLREVDAALHARLTGGLRSAAAGDRAPLRAAGYEVLDRAGGRLMEGYRRQAPEPS